MSLSGKWEADNGNVDIYIVQTGSVFIVNWTEPNEYWNFAAGTVVGDNVRISFESGETAHLEGQYSDDRIEWSNGNSWYRV